MLTQLVYILDQKSKVDRMLNFVLMRSAFCRDFFLSSCHYWPCNQFWQFFSSGSRSVLQANLSDKIISLSPYSERHGTLVPREVTQDSFHRTQITRITSSVTQDGTHVLIVNCLSFYACRTMNHALLSFLDVNRAQLRALSKSNGGKFESTENRLQGYIYCQEAVIRRMQLPYLAYATAFRQISLFIWYARNRRNRLNLSF